MEEEDAEEEVQEEDDPVGLEGSLRIPADVSEDASPSKTLSMSCHI